MSKILYDFCLCGSRLDENGRCPRQEREIYEHLMRGTQTYVCYVNRRTPPQSRIPEDKE